MLLRSAPPYRYRWTRTAAGPLVEVHYPCGAVVLHRLGTVPPEVRAALAPLTPALSGYSSACDG